MSDRTIISYVPLLRTFPSSSLSEEDSRHLKELLGNYPSGEAHGCAWYQKEDGEFGVLLIYEQAEEIGLHLLEWSENDPESWFTMHWNRLGDSYGLALLPVFEKSYERMKVQHQLSHGFPLPPDSKARIISHPLCFSSSRKDVNPGSHLEVRLLEKSDFSLDNWQENEDKSMYIGRFKVEHKSEYVRNVLVNLKKDRMKNTS